MDAHDAGADLVRGTAAAQPSEVLDFYAEALADLGGEFDVSGNVVTGTDAAGKRQVTVAAVAGVQGTTIFVTYQEKP